MTKTQYRVTFTLLGIALAAVVVGAVLFTPDGQGGRLPAAVESYGPTDGSQVLRQTRVEIDLLPGYTVDLVVDGVPIPAEEIDVTEATGYFAWTPGPGKTFSEWAPGLHAVEVRWDRATGLPDPGSLRWSFRTQ